VVIISGLENNGFEVIKKFLALTKDDGKIYDFILWAQIGTVIHGLKVWLNWSKEETNGTINALYVLTQASYFTISR